MAGVPPARPHGPDGERGLRCVCVLTGGWTREELEEAGAAAVYGDVRVLLRDLDGSPLA
ncbi:hypothetical protein [Actinomadura sp. 3N407]|uniref:hypothetical protein n=1 Tax=Actinomadura sp. 3N407 TaxID=3457423 RepID=UPI003FCD8963